MNKDTQTAENLYYRDIDPSRAQVSRREQSHGQGSSSGTDVVTTEDQANISEKRETEQTGQPPYLFATAGQLVDICRKHNLTIAQVVWENELAFRSASEIRKGIMRR